MRSTEETFNFKLLLIRFKTDILLKFYNFFFYVTFFLFFFPKKKEMKLCILRMPKESKKKRVLSYSENSLKSRSEFWVVKKDVTAVISTKMLVKHSHFRDVCSVFTLDLMLCVVAGATRQYFMYPKSEHTECVTRGFSASHQKYTTGFLSSFCFVFLLSFAKEGRKMKEEKIV